MTSTIDTAPLPYGWSKHFHSESGHPFYVDTKATPPRSIWVHPYEDEQYIREHPLILDKVRYSSLPGVSAIPGRRHSYGGHTTPANAPPNFNEPMNSHKRGIIRKLKDKAIGTKEERRERKRRQEMSKMQQQLSEQQRLAPHNQYAPPFGYGPSRRMGGLGGGRNGRAGGMALPLVGGLAGGLLLGDMMDGGMGDYNDGGGF